MEEMEQGSHKVPKGVHTKIVAEHITSGDWLAVIYDKNWWLASLWIHITKMLMWNSSILQAVSFKRGAKDVCFIPVQKILVKLTKPSSQRRASSTRDILR